MQYNDIRLLSPINRGFKFISPHIVSLPKHLEELQSNLSNQLVDLLVLRVNTFLKDELFSIDGHDLLRKDRDRQGVGVAIYIRSAINCLIRQDLDLEGIEGICLEIRRPCSKPFVMLACYRPPISDPSFLVKIEEIIGRIDSEDKEIVLVVDLNGNYLSSNQNNNNNYIPLLLALFSLTHNTLNF